MAIETYLEHGKILNNKLRGVVYIRTPHNVLFPLNLARYIAFAQTCNFVANKPSLRACSLFSLINYFNNVNKTVKFNLNSIYLAWFSTMTLCLRHFLGQGGKDISNEGGLPQSRVCGSVQSRRRIIRHPLPVPRGET